MAKVNKIYNNKFKKVLDEFEDGKLYSGKGKKHKVTSRDQAIAIAISEQRGYNKKKGYGNYTISRV